MNVQPIIINVIAHLGRMAFRTPPPKIEFGPLYDALPKADYRAVLSTSIDVEADTTSCPPAGSTAVANIPVTTITPREESIQQTGCISCSRSHLSTVSGSLAESLRFAREGGIEHPEVQRRLMLAEDEINIMERVDLAPDALAKSPPMERRLAEEYLPKIRALRQNIGAVMSPEALGKIAAEASVLSQEFRLRALQLKGVDLTPVLHLANKVEAGEMTMDEAKEALKELLPEEE